MSKCGEGKAGPISIDGTVVLSIKAKRWCSWSDDSGGIGFQLISAATSGEDGRGLLGKESLLDSKEISGASPLEINMSFYWDTNLGRPGAFYVRNYRSEEFFLKSLALHDVPDVGAVHFLCNTWVYPQSSTPTYYAYPRILFCNHTFVTSKIPMPLKQYAEEELENLRGEHDVERELVESDRIYGYAEYNDLGYDRPILGGNADFPYPRRGKTGRPRDTKYPRYESRKLLAGILQDFYVPRDERFHTTKNSEFSKSLGNSLLQILVPFLKSILWDFQSFEDVFKLYDKVASISSKSSGKMMSSLNGKVESYRVPGVQMPELDALADIVDRLSKLQASGEPVTGFRTPLQNQLQASGGPVTGFRTPLQNQLGGLITTGNLDVDQILDYLVPPRSTIPGGAAGSTQTEMVHGIGISELPLPGFDVAGHSSSQFAGQMIPAAGEDVTPAIAINFFLPKFPCPDVIQHNKEAWRTDEEFAREMLAGMNPVMIRRVQRFPPVSNLDPDEYGDQNSTITEEDISDHLEGISCDEAVKTNRLFILDHHDSLMPYLSDINKEDGRKVYASRTILFLRGDGTLIPVAIELSLPIQEGQRLIGSDGKVYTPCPPESGVQHSIWELAKAYVMVNDSGIHQLISHWLHTHAAVEPFVIATNRRLSVVHPIHKLLAPHFRDTMNINALARKALVSSGGIVEKTVFPGRYAMEMSSAIYKSWNFVDQALPNDLLKRGMAIEDPSQSDGIELVIKNYPYAVDGLQIWSAIEEWVANYCALYYADDTEVEEDSQIQSWWTEIVQEGHGDMVNETWWPEMKTRKDLVFSCTTVIWISSALHAAVNFGQYPYAGFMPNRPTASRRLMPEPGSEEYEELKKNPVRVFLQTVSSTVQTLIGISLIEVLSQHFSDEVYLGEREDPELWTSDGRALEAFEGFAERQKEVEKDIKRRNRDESLRNVRSGAVKVPYTLLEPGKSEGKSKGIPNSISI